MKNKNPLLPILYILLIINLCATAFLAVKLYRTVPVETSTRYIMYIGTNDKVTDEQLISDEDAMALIDSICLKYTDGYTLQPATGSWGDDSGGIVHEHSFICYFYYTDEETVYSIADDVISALNQSCVLIEKNSVQAEYYYGN